VDEGIAAVWVGALSVKPSRPFPDLGSGTATVETWGPDTTRIGTGRDERDPPIGDFFPKAESDPPTRACRPSAPADERERPPLELNNCN
jgi:hypothetical protein